MMKTLEWPSLKDRRLAARLSLLYKIHCNFTAYNEISNQLLPAHYTGRHDHSRKIAEIKISTDKEKYTFLARTIADWNNLPSLFFEPPHANSIEFNKRIHDLLFSYDE